MANPASQRQLAEYLVNENRMIIEPTPDMMQRFPLNTPPGDETAWLVAAAKLLGDATELRRPVLPSGKTTLVVKDRAILFNYTQERTLEDMAKERRGNANA